MHGQIKSRDSQNLLSNDRGAGNKSVGPSKFLSEDMKTIIIAFMSTRTC